MLEPEHGPVIQEDVEHTHMKCRMCVLSCLLLACLYVGSLYIWRSSLPRDHPSVIKRRSASVLLVSALSPAVVKAWMHWADVRVNASVWELMGVVWRVLFLQSFCR
ncbi:hypothetical protein PBY51_002900 [Eleginops maclovinus]|uniref:Uncharacterized protein n=1 Tax=Eleginops maclovinus TaxID=56733 RepID=A0AAN7XB15_ELEMC|nr:hypothetical protein PBY51_002900 [Eleginops maclovinus]